jgi:hypothetical protein
VRERERERDRGRKRDSEREEEIEERGEGGQGQGGGGEEVGRGEGEREMGLGREDGWRRRGVPRSSAESAAHYRGGGGAPAQSIRPIQVISLYHKDNPCDILISQG